MEPFVDGVGLFGGGSGEDLLDDGDTGGVVLAPGSFLSAGDPVGDQFSFGVLGHIETVLSDVSAHLVLSALLTSDNEIVSSNTSIVSDDVSSMLDTLNSFVGISFDIIPQVKFHEVVMSLMVGFGLVMGSFVVVSSSFVVGGLVVGRVVVSWCFVMVVSWCFVVVGVMRRSTHDLTKCIGGSVFSSMLQSICDAISIEHVTKHTNSSFLSHWAGGFFKIIQKVEFLEV